jgi:hypothetical protein
MTDDSPLAATDSDRIESTILEVLGAGESRLWSVAEVGRQVGDELAAADALSSLHRDGLIHRTGDGFVFATRAAIRSSELRF